MLGYELSEEGQFLVGFIIFYLTVLYVCTFIRKRWFPKNEDFIRVIRWIPIFNVIALLLCVVSTLITFFEVPFYLKITIGLMLLRKDYERTGDVIENQKLGITITSSCVTTPHDEFDTMLYRFLFLKNEKKAKKTKRVQKLVKGLFGQFKKGSLTCFDCYFNLSV